MTDLDQTPVAAPTPRNRVADRPHWWTIGLAVGAMTVSAGAFVISMLQYQNALTVRNDARAAAERQRKSLEEAAEAAKENLGSMRALADQSTRSATAAERNAAAAERALSQVLEDDHRLDATVTFGLDDWASRETQFDIRVVLLNRGNRQETVYSAVLVVKDDIRSQSGLYLTTDQKGPFVVAPGQVVPFNLQPALSEGVLDEMK